MKENDPVLSATDEDRIVTHMNEEHTGDLVRYARVLAGLEQATAARMTSIDAAGFELRVQKAEESQTVRIDFETPLETVEEARSALVGLAVAAREEAER